MNFNFKMGVYMNLRIGTKNKAVYLKIGSHKRLSKPYGRTTAMRQRGT